jgi:hypothetical protein
MNHEETITIRVVNWPRFCRTTEFAFDRKLFAGERPISKYLAERFGNGELQKLNDHTWEYVRDIPGPQWWWKLLSLVLNKSYV